MLLLCFGGPDRYFSGSNQYFFDFWGSGGALGLFLGLWGEINQNFFQCWGSGWQQNQNLFEVWGSGGQVWDSRSELFSILGLWGSILELEISIFNNSGALGPWIREKFSKILVLRPKISKIWGSGDHF